jgi:peroxiredoxin Q/BCP
VILGASTDARGSHAAFAQKYNLRLPLLLDEHGALARRYGALGTGMARRVTFVIDRQGRIAEIFDPVKVDGHAAQVRAALAKIA